MSVVRVGSFDPAVKLADTRKVAFFVNHLRFATENRYMLWSGYDTLLLQQVPVMQATSGLGRWKMLEAFTEAFARAWEEEATILLGNSERWGWQPPGLSCGFESHEAPLIGYLPCVVLQS